MQSERIVEGSKSKKTRVYAFEHDAASVVFIVDQEFYGDDDFPNSDFSMLDDRDPRSPETPVDIWL